MTLNETETYIADQIHGWVWSGFFDKDDANRFLDDILEDDVDEEKMRLLIDKEFRDKAKEELQWPKVTDCDRLDNVFSDLNKEMIVAIQNTGYETSDGHQEVGEIHSKSPKETYRGYCFYHGQDLERAVAGDGIMLAFGDMKDTEDGKMKVAEIIIRTLIKHGFEHEWNGKVSMRINIPKIDWKRRLTQ